MIIHVWTNNVPSTSTEIKDIDMYRRQKDPIQSVLVDGTLFVRTCINFLHCVVIKLQSGVYGLQNKAS